MFVKFLQMFIIKFYWKCIYTFILGISMVSLVWVHSPKETDVFIQWKGMKRKIIRWGNKFSQTCVPLAAWGETWLARKTGATCVASIMESECQLLASSSLTQCSQVSRIPATVDTIIHSSGPTQPHSLKETDLAFLGDSPFAVCIDPYSVYCPWKLR